MKIPRQAIIGAVIIILLTLIIYFPSYNGEPILDDDAFIFKSSLMTDDDGLNRIWTDPLAAEMYYPLLNTSFWLEYKILGDNPFHFRLINALIHALTALMLWAVLKKLKVPGAWLAALIFAIHPVNAQSVAWITERKNTLSGLFFFASMLTYLNFSDARNTDDKNPWRLYFIALALFACALTSKTTTVTLPIILLLLQWFRKGKISIQEWTVAPMFIMSGIMSAITNYAEHADIGYELAPAFQESFFLKLSIAGQAILFYIGKIIFPHPLIFSYPEFNTVMGSPESIFYPVFAVSLLVVLYFMRKKIGRAPFTGYAYFVIAILPMLGFLPFGFLAYSPAADYFQYLAIPGIITLIVGLIAYFVTQRGNLVRNAAYAVSVLVVIGLSARTWVQAQLYESKEKLYTHTLRHNPNGLFAYYHLGMACLDQGDYQSAYTLLIRAREIRPLDTKVLGALAVALDNLGKLQEATDVLRETTRLNPTNPLDFINLGIALIKQSNLKLATNDTQGAINELRGAKQALEKAIELDPDNLNAYEILQDIKQRLGE